MIGKALTVASVLTATQAAKQYVATFSGDNDITGTVTIDNGYVGVNIDLSEMPDLTGGFENCTEGGMSYHIHELWDFDDDRTESMTCGADYTGGHWDPWNACGAASGNAYCGDDADNNKCIPKGGDAYVVDYPAMPFSAEVGDWSSKYGKLELTDDDMLSGEYSSFWEVKPEEMAPYSVVFHCNNGDRAFCASFEEGEEDATMTVPEQEGDVAAAAIFSELLAAEVLPSLVTIYADGTITGYLAQDVYVDVETDGCATFEYGVFEATDVELTESALGTDCDAAVGAFYDPTNQCPPFSGSEYCTDGMLCNDADYMYDCDFANDRYSCAPGDFSGKFGAFDPSETLDLDYAGTDSLIPLASDLVGKVMAIYCAEEDQSELTVFACAPIKEYEGTTEEPSGASRVFGVGAVLVAAMAAMW